MANRDGTVAIPNNKELFDIKNWDMIKTRCILPTIKQTIDNEVQTYYTINVADAMKKLTQVGDLLQLAYSHSKGFKCNVTVTKVLSRYQDLIKDTLITSSTFVEVIMKALGYHKMALLFAEKKKCDKGLEMLKKCSTLAQRMADESDSLANMAEDLSKMSEEALLEATKDQNLSEAEKKSILDRAAKVKAALAEQRSLSEDLAVAVAEAREEEEKHRKDAEKQDKISLLTSFVPFVKINKRADAMADRSRSKEDEANKLRKELQTKMRDANAGMKKSVTQLNNSNVEENEIVKSIEALEVTINTMGKIKTIFLNAKQFWVGVQKHCLKLTDNHDMVEAQAELEDIEGFIEEVKVSGYSWLALGRINVEAAEAIRAVDGKVDRIMSNLPSKAEAKELMGKLSAAIVKDLDNDDRVLALHLAEEEEEGK